MNALVTLRPGLTLQSEAAQSWARAEARLGRRLDVNRSLADWDTQMRFYLAWEAYRTGRGAKAPRALHPRESMHCRALAVDSDDGYNAAIVRLLAEHGWIRTASDEPWHFDYITNRDRFRGTGYPAGWTGHPYAPIKEDSMTIQIRRASDGLIAQVDRDYFAAMPDEATADIVKNVFSIADERHKLADVDFYRVTDSCGIPRSVIKPGSYWSREFANEQAIRDLTEAVNAR